MPRVLSIGTMGIIFADLLRAASEAGVEIVAVTQEDVWERAPEHVRKQLGSVAFVSFAAPDIVDEIVSHGRRWGVEGVVTGWEFFTPFVAQVAHALGLPGNDVSRATASRNKRDMAAAFRAHGVAVPGAAEVTQPDRAIVAVRAAGLRPPFVVKPAENAGSVGVTVVHDEAALPAAVATARSWPEEFPHAIPLDNTALVQEYIPGEEFSVESVAFDGEITHLAVTQKLTTSDHRRAEIGHTVPALLPDASRTALLEVVGDALRAVGLRNGVGHTEVKLTPEGTARIIELGTRPAGDHIVRLVHRATGVDPARAYLEVALGRRPETAPTRHDAAAIRFLTAERHGTFRALDGVPEDAGVEEVELYVEPGDEVTVAEDNVGRIAHVLLAAPTPEEANERALRVLRSVRVEVR
jgi:biotin carboxylase